MGDSGAKAEGEVEGEGEVKMKVGFAMKGKGGGAKRKRDVQVQQADAPQEKDFVLSMGDKGLKHLKPVEGKKLKVIPALPNGWRMSSIGNVGGKEATENAKAAVKAKTDAGKPLTLEEKAIAELVKDAEQRKSGEVADDDESKGRTIEGGGGVVEGADSQLGVSGRAGATGGDTDETYRADVESRPQEEEFDSFAYDEMPIESFGKALLRGMGWNPAKGIGKNAKGPVAPTEFVNRGYGHRGLGADAKPDERRERKYIKPGETRGKKPDMIYRDENGVEKSTKSVDAKLVERVARMEKGSKVSVVRGIHEGVGGTVLAMDDTTGYVRVLLNNDEAVRVRRSEVVLGDVKPSRSRKDRYEDEDRYSSSKSGKHKKEKHHKHKKDKKKEKEDRTPIWLRAGLRVKVVSKSFADGKHYNKKAVIQDVHSKRESMLTLDSGKVIESVPQKALETCVPKVGGRVIVVIGEDKGKVGEVMEKRRERAMVQFNQDETAKNYDFDCVCEYVGDIDSHLY